MKTIKKIWSILLVCGLILVPTISVSAAEQEPEKVEVSFFNENGEEVSDGSHHFLLLCIL